MVINEAIRVGTNPIRLVFLSEEEIWSLKETLGMGTQRKIHVRTQGKGSHLKAKERNL